MQRIRYTETGVQGVKRSVKTFSHPSNGGQFYIRLNEGEFRFEIVDEFAERVVAEGSSRSLSKLKIKAKKALESVGVDVGDVEQRKPKKNLVDDSCPGCVAKGCPGCN